MQRQMILKLKSLTSRSLIVVATLLLAVSGFTYYSLSQSSKVEPDVILIGSPTEIPSNLQSKLPTGYRWITEEQFPTDFPAFSENEEEFMKAMEKDHRVVYRLTDELDIEKVKNISKEEGKTEIYLRAGQPDPGTMVPLSLDATYNFLIEDLYNRVGNLAFLLDPFVTKDAWADSVPNRFCSTGSSINAGQCIQVLSTPYYFICFHYTNKSCHWNKMIGHIRKNIELTGSSANINNNNPIGFTHAMIVLGTSMAFPGIFDIDIYKNNFEPGFIDPNTGCGTSNASACGHCPDCGLVSKPSPRPHEGDFIVLSEQHVRNNWSVVRHEFAHNYNYEHCEMDLNFDNVARSINSKGQGTTVTKPLAGCFSIGRNDCKHNNNICSKPPNGTQFPNNIWN
jgi:hypothetical protein